MWIVKETGEAFKNRKEAKQKLGRVEVDRILRECGFIFDHSEE